jgi:RsiW-degrading membrane proteinase PrsW (M82 family)
MAVVSLLLAAGHLAASSIANATAFSLIPVTLVVGAFLWLDRWEPEPGHTLMLAFAWGAGAAVLGALLINSAVDVEYGPTASAIVSAPLAEEGLKGAFLVAMLWMHRWQLDGLVDGVVYAGMVAAGFAFVENIVYLSRAFELGLSDGHLVFVMRGLLTPFAHPLFTVFIGIAVGLAAHRSGVVQVMLPILGYSVAVALHSLWNASTMWDEGRGFWRTYVLVMVPIFAAMVCLALWQRRRERRVVAAHIPWFVESGLVSPSEVQMLCSIRGRRHWRKTARAQSGRGASRAVHAYHRAVTELAFVADRISHGAVSAELVDRHAEALAAVGGARDRAVAQVRS